MPNTNSLNIHRPLTPQHLAELTLLMSEYYHLIPREAHTALLHCGKCDALWPARILQSSVDLRQTVFSNSSCACGSHLVLREAEF